MSTPRSSTGSHDLTRRAALRAGLAGLGVLTVACSTRTPPSAPVVSTASTGADARQALAAVEARMPGRLGVFALDTASGATVTYRADDRFLLCSTGKTLTVAAVLRAGAQDRSLLDRVIRYGPDDVLAWAPETSKHVDAGMTVDALCAAAITVSDNTAANLLVKLMGGPPAITQFARSLGDDITRIDRVEPDLNVTSPGDLRDTSTPARMAENLRVLTLEDALPPEARMHLTDLLVANTTGGQAIRAGLPPGWKVGDKTGSGAQGESNDIAVAWPPGRAPLVISVYTSPTDPKLPAERAHHVIAEATSIAVQVLTGP